MADKIHIGVLLPPKAYDTIHGECENNGWPHSVAVKIGLECFLSATWEQRMELLKKFNKRLK